MPVVRLFYKYLYDTMKVVRLTTYRCLFLTWHISSCSKTWKNMDDSFLKKKRVKISQNDTGLLSVFCSFVLYVLFFMCLGMMSCQKYWSVNSRAKSKSKYRKPGNLDNLRTQWREQKLMIMKKALHKKN